MFFLKLNSNPKQLFSKISESAGRNSLGRITVRGRGSRLHRKRFKLVDFGRFLWNIPGLVLSIHFDTFRNCYLGLISYVNGAFSYIILPESLYPGDAIIAGVDVSARVGNSLPLKNIPFNTPIHNIELVPRGGAKFLRSGGSFGVIVKKTSSRAFIKVKHKNFLFSMPLNCFATIGRVSNKQSRYLIFLRAGQRRNLGFRPKVRGVAKNPSDHPHGGGEGKKSAKRLTMSPWGKLGKGVKTSKSLKQYKNES